MSRSPTALVRRIDTRYRTVRSTRSAESMGRRQHGLRTCRQADHRCRMSDIQLMAGAIRAASKKPLRYLREAARLPLQQQAAARMAALPVVELADLAGDVRETAVRLAPSESRHGWSLGVAYRDSAAAHKITQILGDSVLYDFSPYEKSADLVLVDAGHEYVNGFADTNTALQLIRPGGIILWDDFEPYWHGLVNGICDAMQDRGFGPLAGTSLAVYAA